MLVCNQHRPCLLEMPVSRSRIAGLSCSRQLVKFLEGSISIGGELYMVSSTMGECRVRSPYPLLECMHEHALEASNQPYAKFQA